MSDRPMTVETTLLARVETWQDVLFRVRLTEEEDHDKAAGRIWIVTKASAMGDVELVSDPDDLPDVILQAIGEEALDAEGERAAKSQVRDVDDASAAMREFDAVASAACESGAPE